MDTLALRDQSTEALLEIYAKNRDPQLRATIIERHEALVRSLAHKFARPGVPVEQRLIHWNHLRQTLHFGSLT